jgi:hypothetical protein
MIWRLRGRGRVLFGALAVASGIALFPGSSIGGGADGAGTLGYGPPGVYPGFQGFGLGYHLGYGYGGKALGPGAEGGYPFYGGPGYPHPWPVLQRCPLLTINPFPYYGGPGFPTPECPNYFGGTGPLVPTAQVVTIGGSGGDPGSYGCFTGAHPYTEAQLAPFTTAAGTRGSFSGAGGAPTSAAPVPAPSPPQARTLGIDADPIVDADGVPGLKISRVTPGSAAEKAGLHAGDMLYAINGYVTTQRSDLTWIATYAAPDNILRMRFVSASDGKEHTITVRLP